MSKLSTEQKALYSAITKILWEKWDPIGVNDGDNEWDDEYDNYVPHIFRLALEGNDAIRIACSLTSTVEQIIGLGSDKESDLKVAKLIVQAKQEIIG
ncbi:hypothetical protein [Shewanella woodyi]|uniref:hypothetical protein n=1 Tax=Shewanella woodyi TaxID=60961 RepID=UPI0007F869F1|nr:hypothetical protein [Shewanella woodyi]